MICDKLGTFIKIFYRINGCKSIVYDIIGVIGSNTWVFIAHMVVLNAIMNMMTKELSPKVLRIERNMSTTNKSESTEKGAYWANEVIPSDIALMDLLRKQDSMTIAELSTAMGVTATAVRQRLNRLMAQGHLERFAEKAGRGRPIHQYRLSEKGKRKSGANFADLAVALWEEIRSIQDQEVRQGLIQRISKRMADLSADEFTGKTSSEKVDQLKVMFGERRIPVEIDRTNELPIVNILACPYPDLAEQDRAVCTMEKMLMGHLLERNVTLSECRLDGSSCCKFELS
ncbi:MAG: ArsR family transcriptional regulator [Blastopirellula sp.]|nr:MAG: ArsR family transcriptional regulator [Blastopirellula sp.]